MDVPNFEDALSYVKRVKLRFTSQPWIYNDFLGILREFNKDKQIDCELGTLLVINRVSTLFIDNPDLVIGFEAFLHPEYEVQVDDPCQIVHESIHAPLHADSEAEIQPQSHPEIYGKFVDILHTYQNEQHHAKESGDVTPASSEAQIFEQMENLFKSQNQDDLLTGCGQVLQDANQSIGKTASELSAGSSDDQLDIFDIPDSDSENVHVDGSQPKKPAVTSQQIAAKRRLKRPALTCQQIAVRKKAKKKLTGTYPWIVAKKELRNVEKSPDIHSGAKRTGTCNMKARKDSIDPGSRVELTEAVVLNMLEVQENAGIERIDDGRHNKDPPLQAEL